MHVPTDSIPPTFVELIKSSNLDQKRAMLVALNNSINQDIKKLTSVDINFDQYVHHINHFLPDNNFDEEVLADVTELGLFKKSSKPVTQWLSMDSRDYCFSENSRFKHPPKDIRKFHGICKLMEKVNNEPNTTQNADSALVIVYNTNKAEIDFHDDGGKTYRQQKLNINGIIWYIQDCRVLSQG